MALTDVTLPAWHILTVTAASGQVFWNPAGDKRIVLSDLSGSAVSLGPFSGDRQLFIDCRVALTCSISEFDASSLQAMFAKDVFLLVGNGVPVNYTDGDPLGTGEGVAEKGSIYSDCTNGKLYVNGGTKAQPIWKIVTSAS